MIAKSKKEIEILKKGGQILARVLSRLAKEARPGIKISEFDRIADAEIKKAGAEPSFKGYCQGGKFPYPAVVCVSVNDEIVHGIPGQRILQAGDVVGIDLGVKYKGLFTDAAITVISGPDTSNKHSRRLISVCSSALDIGIAEARAGSRVGDIGHAIQSFVEKNGFRVIKELVGHGVGRAVHEEPQIPNWGRKGNGPALKEGQVLAIEPMITAGSPEIVSGADGWVWKTKDGATAAHFEHTILVKRDGSEILTL